MIPDIYSEALDRRIVPWTSGDLLVLSQWHSTGDASLRYRFLCAERGHLYMQWYIYMFVIVFVNVYSYAYVSLCLHDIYICMHTHHT